MDRQKFVEYFTIAAFKFQNFILRLWIMVISWIFSTKISKFKPCGEIDIASCVRKHNTYEEDTVEINFNNKVFEINNIWSSIAHIPIYLLYWQLVARMRDPIDGRGWGQAPIHQVKSASCTPPTPRNHIGQKRRAYMHDRVGGWGGRRKIYRRPC